MASILSRPQCVNWYPKPSYHVATVCHQVCCVYWASQPILHGWVSLKCISKNLHRELLSHLGRDKNGRPFPYGIFKCIFLNENVYISIQFALKFFPRAHLTIFQHWFRKSLGTVQAPMSVSLLTHKCVTRPQWVIQSGPYQIYEYVSICIRRKVLSFKDTPLNFSVWEYETCFKL